ncbi:MAG: Ig-like domain-containing protein [Lachnospiraceae bacterium]|nr:Ig-like domain-containing protein [Lachnospiraceae bacterium]
MLISNKSNNGTVSNCYYLGIKAKDQDDNDCDIVGIGGAADTNAVKAKNVDELKAAATPDNTGKSLLGDSFKADYSGTNAINDGYPILTWQKSNAPAVPATRISLNKTSTSLNVRGKETLTATLEPEGCTDEVEWSSEDEGVAIVTKTGGVVTGVGAGETYIVAKAGSVSAKCKVTVTEVATKGVLLDKSTANLRVGEDTTLVATVNPDTATYNTPSWTSSNEDVASVDETGKVTALSAGKTVITASAGGKEASCVVTVTDVSVTKVTLNKRSTTMLVGEYERLVPMVAPSDATGYTVEWLSSNKEVATVTNGVITAKAEGTAIITVTADGVSDFCSVTVSNTAPVETDEEKTTNAALLEAIKTQLNKDVSFKPSFINGDRNICEFLMKKIYAYKNLKVDGKSVTADGVSVSIKDSNRTDTITDVAGVTNGDINFVKDETLSSTVSSRNITFTVILKKGNETNEFVLDGAFHTMTSATVGWDINHFRNKMKEEAEGFTFDKIKGSNTSESNVTSNLNLPDFTTGKSIDSWSKIEWSSSDPAVIEVKSEYGVTTGVVKTPKADTVVGLTAKFKPNDGNAHINTSVDDLADFGEFNLTFNLVVKGTGSHLYTQEEVEDLFHTYYLTDNAKAAAAGKSPLQNFKVTGSTEVIDKNNVRTDIQLPRYTNLKDEKGKRIFSNKEIKVEAVGNDNLLTVSGYRVSVDRGASAPKKCSIKFSFTRDGHTASQTIDFNVIPFTNQEIIEAQNLMKFAKEHYWDAINVSRDGNYQKANESKDKVTVLNAFQEINKGENGKLEASYRNSTNLNTGIMIQGYFDDKHSEEMEGAGYNNFKSSNPSVVQHDNLVIANKPEYDTKVRISSVLCHSVFKETALKHPENAKLAELINQEVSVVVTVLGEKGANPNGTPEPPEEVAGRHKDVNVLLTVADKGTLLKANDGSLMAQKKVVAKDINEDGTVTYDEALVAAHDTYNKAAGYERVGAKVVKLWGIEADNSGYVNDGAFIPKAVTQVPVEENDNLTAFIYKDDTTWTDKYAFFDVNSKAVKTGESFELTLKALVPATNSKVAFANATVKSSDGKVLGKTDSNGKVKLSFGNAGTYSVYAEGTINVGGVECQAVPATCIVTVTGNPTPVNPDPTPTPQPEPKPVAVKTLKLNKTTATIDHGKTLKLKATVNPSNGTIKWTNSKPEVATMVVDGKTATIKGLKGGKTTITVKSSDGKKSAKCTVTVKGPAKVSGVTVSAKPTKIKIGKTTHLTAKISPANAENKNVTWKSLTPGIASVEGNGLKATVKGLKAGKAKIRVTAQGGKHKDITITVDGPVEVKSVKIAKTSSKLTVGKTLKLTAKLNPTNAENKTVKWESLTPEIASVTSKGLKATVKGLKEGTAKIKVTTANGKTKEIKLTVSAAKSKSKTNKKKK